MKIVVAAVSSNLCMSGVSRHAANLVRCLHTRPEISAVHVLVAEWEQKYVAEAIGRTDTRLYIHPVSLRTGNLRRNIWYYRTLPAIAGQLRADVVHITYPSPIQKGAFPCPVITTLHDLYPYVIPSNFGIPKVYFNQIILRQCLRHTDAIACVSDSTRSQLRASIPGMATKAFTVHNCSEIASVAVKPAFAINWADRPYLMCVAQHRHNKNIPVALRAFKSVLASGAIDSDMHFLLVGMCGPETRRIEGLIRCLGIEKKVLLVTGISDPELNWCYRNCELLIAPSIVEGFGLPIAEGLAAGCRIVCSDIPPFREIGTGACKFVELGTDVDKRFASAIIECLGKKRPLPIPLPNLSTTAISAKYLKLYCAVLDTWKNAASSQISPSTLDEATTPEVTRVPASPNMT